ncbi:RIP metalloprotease RseP [Paroceanicella profunda]|uniref:Zinc metalloprotease n=1 Tax=Paroceanicella profunda TaxID=2579971 RepID=A0A5B8FHQ6_9RHOB|nr:RIP metalloprotease RseP [Paroceanicella profunda]QDL92741.1 RIP metalloprotease RseP [Paroceanicella profunda]
MEFAAELADKLYYLWFIVVLGIVVFVHEYGHYIVGRWCGIHAEVFSIGFGKELFAWTDSRGTRWRIGLLPLGGFVKFLGDADGTSSAPDDAALAKMDARTLRHSFHGAAVWRRALAVAAGPVFNFILSVVVFAGLAMWQGQAVPGAKVGSVSQVEGHDFGLRAGDEILSVNGAAVTGLGGLYATAAAMPQPGPLEVTLERDGREITTEIPYVNPPLVGWVAPMSAAMGAGLRENDLITAIDGTPIASFRELQQMVMASQDKSLSVSLLRDGQPREVTLTPVMTDIEDGQGGYVRRPVIGISSGVPIMPELRTPMPWEAASLGVERTWSVIAGSVSGIYHIIAGDVSARNLQGPLGIMQVSGDTARSGLDDLVNLLAVISTAIGFLNLMPVPVLDGGHLVFLGYEAVRGRPPADRWVEYASGLGLAMVLMLMLFATYNDVLRLIGLA